MADDKHTQPEVDRLTGISTTGHEWDGIKELNTPLPRWWLWTFYVTIVWAIGYMVVYPAIPLISSHTVGLLGYTNRAAVQVELAKLETQRNIQAAGLADASFEQIRANPDLSRIALARGEKVLRYGFPIGTMTEAAELGEHVHKHNLASDYLPAHGRDAVRTETGE